MLLKVFLLIIMVVIIYMVNILTTRENRVLSFNSIIQTNRREPKGPLGSTQGPLLLTEAPLLLTDATQRQKTQRQKGGRSYTDKNSNSGEAPIALQGKGLDPN